MSGPLEATSDYSAFFASDEARGGEAAVVLAWDGAHSGDAAFLALRDVSGQGALGAFVDTVSEAGNALSIFALPKGDRPTQEALSALHPLDALEVAWNLADTMARLHAIDCPHGKLDLRHLRLDGKRIGVLPRMGRLAERAAISAQPHEIIRRDQRDLGRLVAWILGGGEVPGLPSAPARRVPTPLAPSVQWLLGLTDADEPATARELADGLASHVPGLASLSRAADDAKARAAEAFRATRALAAPPPDEDVEAYRRQVRGDRFEEMTAPLFMFVPFGGLIRMAIGFVLRRVG